VAILNQALVHTEVDPSKAPEFGRLSPLVIEAVLIQNTLDHGAEQRPDALRGTGGK
jgi:hypothetical protein